MKYFAWVSPRRCNSVWSWLLAPNFLLGARSRWPFLRIVGFEWVAPHIKEANEPDRKEAAKTPEQIRKSLREMAACHYNTESKPCICGYHS